MLRPAEYQKRELDKILMKLEIQKAKITPQQPVSLNTIETFIQRLTIINKEGQRQPLILHPEQWEIWKKIRGRWEQGLPAWCVCLKARQMGVSTLLEAVQFAMLSHEESKRGLVVAHDWDSSLSLFGMTQRYYDYQPENWRMLRPLDSRTTRSFTWGHPWDCKFSVSTANNPNLGRGSTLHYVHASEVAFWEKPKETMTSLLQSIPSKGRVLFVAESTANGANNFFHRFWTAAQRGDNGFIPIFLSWADFEEYQIDPPKGWIMTREERDYQVKYGLSDRRMAWASFTRRLKCFDSWDKFNQEYPITPEIAFISGASMFFTKAAIEAIKETVKESKRGTLVWKEAQKN